LDECPGVSGWDTNFTTGSLCTAARKLLAKL
jgi:hypothetical protein